MSRYIRYIIFFLLSKFSLKKLIFIPIIIPRYFEKKKKKKKKNEIEFLTVF